MTTIGYILLILGGLTSIAGIVMFLTAVYKRSLWWFIGCLFVPILFFVFLFVDTKTAIRPFALAVAGLLLECVGANMAGIDY